MKYSEGRKVYQVSRYARMLIVRLFLIDLLTKYAKMSCIVSVVNDNVNNVYLMTSLIYVTVCVVAIFITPVFLSHWRTWYKKPT